MEMKTLKNICISLIAKEFERFHLAISISNDDTLIQNLELLQRKYSYELGSELIRIEKFQKEYLEFFINEHLKILDLVWLEYSSRLTSVLDIFRRLPNLTKAAGCDCICNDEIIKNIAKFCPKIVEINAQQSDVTDTGIKYLCKDENGKFPCPELKKVHILESKVTDEGVIYLLQNLPSLQIIDYDTLAPILYSLHKKELPKLENVAHYNLISLKMLYVFHHLPYYSDLLKICLTVCPRLKSISCYITDKKQLTFFKNSHLEDVTLHFIKLASQHNIDNFLKLNGCNLVSLNISDCIISLSCLAISCPKLQYLCLDNVTISNKDKSDPQSALPCLEKCDFENYEDHSSMDEAMRFLVLSAPNLQDINFSDCALSNDTKVYILKCSENHHLKRILFEEIPIEMNFVKDILSNCPSLELVQIYYCGMGRKSEELILFAKNLPNKPKVYTTFF